MYAGIVVALNHNHAVVRYLHNDSHLAKAIAFRVLKENEVSGNGFVLRSAKRRSIHGEVCVESVVADHILV